MAEITDIDHAECQGDRVYSHHLGPSSHFIPIMSIPLFPTLCILGLIAVLGGLSVTMNVRLKENNVVLLDFQWGKFLHALSIVFGRGVEDHLERLYLVNMGYQHHE